jgi:hypothetical protein
LSTEQRARFERIFDVQVEQGECVITPAMREWTAQRFGSVKAVEHQTVVRVMNRVTWEGAIFNPLRALRPMLTRAAQSPSSGEDVFAQPHLTTAADTYGRIRGEYCITTSNIARWGGQCSVLIFDEPDPLAFTRDHLRDYFRTALRWADAAHAVERRARHLVWMWNGGAAGGASIPHAHAQMGLAQHTPYAMVDALRCAAASYRAQWNADYFDDLWAAHDDVGLAMTLGSLRGFVSLTAARARDTWILAPAFNDALADALYMVLRAFIERAGMRGFDVGVVMPPIFPQADDADWTGFPMIARIVDRGSPDAISSDLGAMDIFAQRVISDDPYVTRSLL